MISFRSTLLRAFRSGIGTAVSVVIIGTIAVGATPHIRGVAFFPELRFAVLAPACFLVSIIAAFQYDILIQKYTRPRFVFATILIGFSAIVLLVLILFGAPGLAMASLLALISCGACIVFLVPRFSNRPTFSRITIIAIFVFGSLEITGVVLAFQSERSGSDGLAFEIPREMFDVEHKFVNLPSGARIHYVDEGEGETLLFLHGNPSWSFQWRDLIQSLMDSYRCIALDYPGFGLSEAPPGYGFTPHEQSLILEEFANYMKLQKITLVMQDWGGPIGLRFAGRRPELISRVILGSTWAWKTETNTPRGIFSKIAGGPIGEFLQINFNGFVNVGIKNGIVRTLSPDLLDVYTRPFRPLDRRGIAAFYPGQITAATEFFTEVETGLDRLTDKNALIFWALKDQGFPREDLIRFEKAFPKHKTIELPHANHFFFEDSLDLMVPEIRLFLSSNPIRSTQ